MPFVLLLFGVLLTVAGVRNKQGDLFTLLKGDLTGSNNFIYWALSIFAVGAVGYVPRLKPVSQLFLALVVLVLFIAHKGFFAQFQQAISTTQSGAAASSGSSGGATGSTGSSSTLPATPSLVIPPGVQLQTA